MIPTQGFIQKINERSVYQEIILGRENQVNRSPKLVAPIHSVVMGDFQLQNWRALKPKQRRRSHFWII